MPELCPECKRQTNQLGARHKIHGRTISMIEVGRCCHHCKIITITRTDYKISIRGKVE